MPLDRGPGRQPSAARAGGPAEVRPPSITLPKGGGAIRGIGETFAANPVTGTGSLTVPIATSPGRSGFGPQLSLSYDSGAGNGPFGFGWHLSIPSITRKTDKGLPRYCDGEESDVFILSGAEDLVPALVKSKDGHWVLEPLLLRTINNLTYSIRRYRPRIEGLFARIERWTNVTDASDSFWRSISKDNITTWYGRSTESRITDPTDPHRVFSWLICESHDDKGNVVVYGYKAEDSAGVQFIRANERNRVRTANRYLKRIRYGNRVPYFPKLTDTAPWPTPPAVTGADGSDQWLFEVVFDYGEHDTKAPTPNDPGFWSVRNDPFSSYRSGFEIRTYRLCRRALMFHHFKGEKDVSSDCLVRSTDFEYSFEEFPNDARNPVYSFLLSITQTGYKRKNDTYLSKSFPPAKFAYADAVIDPIVHTVAPESLENLPLGLDGSAYEWIDLDGEGLSGILSEQAGAWFYKRNLSPLPRRDAKGADLPIEARFGALELVSAQTTVSIAAGHAQFMDLAGDGQPDLVQFDRPVRGFFERTEDAGWEPFRPFRSWPNIDPHDTNLRFVDLDGDGHADIFITEDDVFRWHPSLAENGFGPEERVDQSSDEDAGPHFVFADGTQSFYLADLSGDGLSDLVRIRNGEVCYWPNLGYGRFGAKVTMDNSPWFDAPDQFDQRRIRLADIDGSGTTDIIYLYGGGPRLYFNQSGNSWSPAHTLAAFPSVDDLASIQALDLLGNGTTCLVWSSPLPGNTGRQMRYIDLMGGEKPHLLVSTVNNIGAETRVEYAPSTKFYLQDKENGKPWVTRLPFPVHVVERVITYDYISRNRFVTRRAYHNGYFDGPERELRGFGCVEQWDTEQSAALTGDSAFLRDTNTDKGSHVPPVRTVTWFHTGTFIDENRISRHMANEYYGAPSENDADFANKWAVFESSLLPDTIPPADALLPDGSRDPSLSLTPDELREAVRALKGSVLRQEVYGEDGSAKAPLPYTVSERNYTLECLQPRGDNRYAVFFAHTRETIDYDHERDPADPRVSHALTVKVDGFGNVLKSVAIGYGRRTDNPNPVLTAADRAEQKRTYVVCTENEYTEPIQANDDYRAPLIAESRNYEVLRVSPGTTITAASHLFGFDEIVAKIEAAGDGKHEILYEDIDATSITDDQPCRRLIERVRTLYRSNSLTGLLPLKKLHSRALPGESFKLAFTPGLLASVFSRKRPDGTAEDLLPDPAGLLGQKAGEGGGYVDLDGDNHWWIPTGRIFYSPISGDTAAAELTCAREHFFLPRRYRDPFHGDQFPTETSVTYDPYDLLTQETQDALGNRVTVGERNTTGELTACGNDYRVLQPQLITDPNGNRSEVVFDALGLVTGTAVMGKKPTLGFKAEGDLLDDQFVADPTQKQIAGFLDNPLTQAAGLLAKATARIIYDLDCFQSTFTKYPDNPDQWQPVFAATLVRETHFHDPLPDQGLKIQMSFSYSDGFGREIQKKIQAEPETKNGAVGPPRWVASGWTIFNNKGKPVRQYEPFFDETHLFKFGEKVGVSLVLFYNPMERVIATLHPDNTYEKIIFDPWSQTSWGVNDTVLLDPRTDPDISSCVGSYFETQPGTWRTWLQERIADPQHPPADSHGQDPERDAAVRTLGHANTPSSMFFDALGRTFLTVTDNGPDQNATPQKYCTRVTLDIENNQREGIDAKDRVVMRYDYDMLGNRVHQASMEAGERWILNDAAGKPLYSWDSRGHEFRTSYDQLRRPVGSWLLEGTGPEILLGRSVYGDTKPEPEANNIRGKVYQAFDEAGIVTNEAYDFKGNLLHSSRQLAVEYKSNLDWSATVSLEPEVYSSNTTYDALNRPVELTTPHTTSMKPSLIRPGYDQANLLARMEANLNGGSEATTFITNIDYNAKSQRTLVEYGILDKNSVSRVKTEYEYDPLTFRLTRILTTRDTTTQLQALKYHYDPAGNITHIEDEAQQSIYFNNQRVDPSGDYLYDAIYRLVEARGREHLGQSSGPPNSPTAPDAFNKFHTGLLHPGDGNAMGTYVEQYVYDAVGNFLSMQHRGSSLTNPGWTRTYSYAEASLLGPAKKSNRLSSTRIGQTTQTYRYEGSEGLHGNITSMPHLPLMKWDCHDQLHATAQQVVADGGLPEITWYTYDAGGQRVRKVTDSALTADAVTAGTKPVRLKERIYLGGFEVYREYKVNDGIRTLEREAVHIMDGKRRVALIETKTYESGFLNWLSGILTESKTLIRYQFDNHLGSACLELDEKAAVISYEEFFPYGSTSYEAVDQKIKAEARRYRYTGKEQDEESGLYYYGARHYAPWIARWTSCDPNSDNAVRNAYVYASNNPVSRDDPTGRDDWSVTIPRLKLKPVGPITTGHAAQRMAEAIVQQHAQIGSETELAHIVRPSGRVYLMPGDVSMVPLRPNPTVALGSHSHGFNVPWPSDADIAAYRYSGTRVSSIYHGTGRTIVHLMRGETMEILIETHSGNPLLVRSYANLAEYAAHMRRMEYEFDPDVARGLSARSILPKPETAGGLARPVTTGPTFQRPTQQPAAAPAAAAGDRPFVQGVSISRPIGIGLTAVSLVGILLGAITFSISEKKREQQHDQLKRAIRGAGFSPAACRQIDCDVYFDRQGNIVRVVPGGA